MGKETAQIEVDEAAKGIFILSIGLKNTESWYVDY